MKFNAQSLAGVFTGATMLATVSTAEAQQTFTPVSPTIYEPLCINVPKIGGGTARFCATDEDAQRQQPGRPPAKYLNSCVAGNEYYLTEGRCYDVMDPPLPRYQGPALMRQPS